MVQLGPIRLWNAATSKPRKTLKGHGSHALAVACSPDGKTVASAGDEPTVALSTIAAGKLPKEAQ